MTARILAPALAVASAAMLTAGFAHAATVNLKYDGPVSGRTVNTSLTLPVGTATYVVGQYKLKVDTNGDLSADSSFEAYCIDPDQFSSSAWKPYEMTAFSSFAAHTGYADVLKLYYNAYGAVASAEDAAAFQLALWEVWKDTTHDLASGNVRKTGSTNATVLSKAEALLADLPTWTSQADPSGLVAYTNTDYQDYVVVGMISLPVPEAETYALAALGMGMVAMIARRRQRPIRI
jgi:hypothetical protein